MDYFLLLSTTNALFRYVYFAIKVSIAYFISEYIIMDMLSNKWILNVCLAAVICISKEFVKCSNCAAVYKKRNDILSGIKEKDNSAIYKIKDYLKKYRSVFFFTTLWEFYGKKKDIIKIFQRELIIDIASGVINMKDIDKS